MFNAVVAIATVSGFLYGGFSTAILAALGAAVTLVLTHFWWGRY